MGTPSLLPLQPAQPPAVVGLPLYFRQILTQNKIFTPWGSVPILWLCILFSSLQCPELPSVFTAGQRSGPWLTNAVIFPTTLWMWLSIALPCLCFPNTGTPSAYPYTSSNSKACASWCWGLEKLPCITDSVTSLISRGSSNLRLESLWPIQSTGWHAAMPLHPSLPRASVEEASVVTGYSLTVCHAPPLPNQQLKKHPSFFPPPVYTAHFCSSLKKTQVLDSFCCWIKSSLGSQNHHWICPMPFNLHLLRSSCSAAQHCRKQISRVSLKMNAQMVVVS